MRSAERRKVNVLEIKCLRRLFAVSRIDRVRNEEVRWRAGIEMELTSRADQRVLRWFGYVERMYDYCRVRGIRRYLSDSVINLFFTKTRLYYVLHNQTIYTLPKFELLIR